METDAAKQDKERHDIWYNGTGLNGTWLNNSQQYYTLSEWHLAE
jgi:hypothetical protein